jgi:hypothetical protein
MVSYPTAATYLSQTLKLVKNNANAIKADTIMTLRYRFCNEDSIRLVKSNNL